jgi:hypothetical protein
VAEENVHIHAEMDDEVSHALGKARNAAEEADVALSSLGRGAARAGSEMDRGMSKGARATNRARDAAGRFIPVGKAAGSTAAGAGRKAGEGSIGWDEWAKKADKASRAAGGLSAMMMVIKFGTLIAGGQAAIGMLMSLAAGAVMAVGALSPMVGVVGALGPGLALMAATMGLMKISGEDIKALFVPLGNEFKAMRYDITQGLVPGIQEFTQIVKNGLIPAIKGGLVGFAHTIGDATVKFGAMISTGRNSREIGVIFNGLRPIVLLLAGSLGRLVGVFLNLAMAALPMTTSMAEGLDRVTVRLEAWSQRMTDSGRAQAWMTRSWELMKSAGRTLWNVLVGLYNIFRLAGQVGREEFAGGMGEGAKRFREWTESAKGTATILQFFRDSAPILRETGNILMTIGRGLAHMGAQKGLADLLHKVNTELLPALGASLKNFMGDGGMGPALVDMFTALFTVLSNVPLGGMTIIIQSLATLIWGIAWLIDHVPGLGPAIGLFLTMWTVAGAAFKVASIGFRAMGWITDLAGPTKDLTIAQKSLKLVFDGVSWAVRGVGEAVVWAIRGIGLAIATNPVGAIIVGILLLVGILTWAYFKFQWFRDFVDMVFHGIADGAVWLGKAIAQPFIDLWNGIKWIINLIIGAWNSFPSFTVPEWIPGVGGKVFALPKIPLLAEGGTINYRTAIVGEQGPEAIVKDGRLLGMVGLDGPELRTDLPVGGYVVPNPATLARSNLSLPSSVADAVSSVLPNYAALLDHNSAPGPAVNVDIDTGATEVVDAIHELAEAITHSRPAPATSPDLSGLVKAITSRDRRDAIAARYHYTTGGRL